MQEFKMKEKTLTESQKGAINHFKGPALVVAGPGAGKTFVITERVKNLIKNHKISPKNILVTTFTEKSADELKIKLARTIGRDAELIHISTIHSFCKSMLEKYFLNHEYGAEIKVLDDESQTLFIQLNKVVLGLAKWDNKILKNLKRRYDFIADVKKLYEQMTQNRIDSEELIKELKRTAEIDDLDEQIIRSYDVYCALLKKDKEMDFSMLEMNFFQMIETNPSVLENIRNQFTFILVDEYQDTSPIQDKIFKKILDVESNLFVVGDENQSIYGFRGASIENFKKFLSFYEGAKSYFLDVNFRSTESIVNFSNKVFEGEVKKILKAKRRKGEQFKIIEGEDAEESAKKTIELIKELKHKGVIKSYGDVVLLFRSLKGHSPDYVKYLSNEKIPFVTFGDGKFLERFEIRTIIYLISYVTQELYLDNNFKKWTNWWRKDIFLSEFFDFDESTKKIISDGGFNLFNLRDKEDFIKQKFINEQDIEVLKNINKLKYEVQREKESFGDLEKGNNSLLKIFYKLINYSGYFQRLMNNKDIESKEILHNLGRLSEIIAKYIMLSKKEDVKGFLYYIYSIEDKIDQKKLEDENTVKLMTVHKSKGLEFPVVFMCSMNEGRFPLRYWDRSMIKIPNMFLDKNSENEQESFYQEERRLFYVGLTRAQDLLIFTTSNKIITQSSKKSRFLEIIEDEIIEDDFKLPIEKKYKLERKIPSLNYSAINTYITCPLKYTLNYDFNFSTPISFVQGLGIIIHNVLQRIHEKMKNNAVVSPSDMKSIIATYWIDLPIPEKRNNQVKEKLTREFVKYYIEVKEEYAEILAIEESFSHIDDNMIVKGKIDLIVKDKDGNINLVDFKSRQKQNIDKMSVDKQLQMYAYCLDNEYKLDNLYAYTFWDHQKTPFEMDNEHIRKFLMNISQQMFEENFHPKPSPLCSECEFKFYCEGKK